MDSKLTGQPITHCNGSVAGQFLDSLKLQCLHSRLSKFSQLVSDDEPKARSMTLALSRYVKHENSAIITQTFWTKDGMRTRPDFRMNHSPVNN